MKTNTSQKIIQYLKDRDFVTAHELVDYLEISRQALFKHLNKLLGENRIVKTGKPPKVFYSFTKEPKTTKKTIQAKAKIIKIPLPFVEIIEKTFLDVSPAGEPSLGLIGFFAWCERNNLEAAKTAREYIKTLKKYDKYKKRGLINGMSKMKSTFEKVFLDQLFYLDFYSIERFGKTKLGQMLLYAKQSQNKKLIKELVRIIQPKIQELVKTHKISAIGFVPPTVKREVQFMKELEKNLVLDLPVIKITKIKTPIMKPQKTITKLKDRIENAKSTFAVEEKQLFDNILLIDDAVGSGATLNEIAQKIKNKKIVRNEIIGLAITGSFKGFEVISEI